MISAPRLLSSNKAWTIWLLAAVLPFLLLAGYNYPSIHDDYLNANGIRSGGRLEYIQVLYQTWTGRYTELLLKATLHPLSYERTALLAGVEPVVVILLFVGGLSWLFSLLLRTVPQRYWLATTSGLLVFLLFANGVPDVGAALYWFGGYTSYTAGVVFSIYALAGLLALELASTASRRLGYFLVATAAALLATGAYDTCLLAMLWGLGSISLWAWYQGNPNKWWYTAVLLLDSIGAAVSAGAPGNVARAASRGHDLKQLLFSSEVQFALVKSACYSLRSLLVWQNSLLLLAGTVVVVGTLARNPATQRLFRGPHPLLLLLWLVAGCTLVVLPSILIYQNVWFHTWHCVYGYFLLSWLWIATVVFVRYQADSPLLQSLVSGAGQTLSRTVFVLLSFGLVTGNTQRAYADLLFRAGEHYRRVRGRERAVQNAKAGNQQVGTVTYLYSRYEDFKIPQVLYAVEFNERDLREYAHFHGLDSVRVVIP